MRLTDISDDELREWRKSPVTMAFVEELNLLEAMRLSDMLSAACRDASGEPENTTRRMAGYVQGLRAVKTMMEDK